MKNTVREPWEGYEYLVTEGCEVDWKGTPGLGDILFGLNAVHMITHLERKKRDLPQMIMNVHWDHSEDYLYHYEDPETIIERAEYLHNFYYDKDAVKMVHHFDAYDEELWRIRHRHFARTAGPQAVLAGLPCWSFRPEVRCTNPNPKKVVFWRTLFNREWPRGWKRIFTNDDWERILDILRSKGYEPVELTYRTPIREAFYHINTSQFCIFYDGMFQYIAKNLCKPVIAIGDNKGILPVHNQQGVFFYKPDDEENSLWKYLDKLPNIEEHLYRRAKIYKDFIEKELCLK